MAYRAYRCRGCGKIFYGFEDAVRLDLIDLTWDHEYEILPPDPFVIHTTDCFMAEPMLDSIGTAYELDRILNMEAKQLKEDALLDQIRKNL